MTRSRAKELLDAATPLPWQYFPDDGEGDELQDGNGEMIASGFRDWVFLEGKPIAEDAALIVYAVNTLPAYEAAVEALREIEATENTRLLCVDHGGDRGQPGECGCGISLDGLTKAKALAREALSRLQEQTQ